MHTHAHACMGTERQGLRACPRTASPARTLSHSGVSQLGLALRWPSSQQRNADSWGYSASGREGEAPGKPHGQEARQACQAEAGPSGARNCAGGGRVQILAYSCLSHRPVSLEPLGLKGEGVSDHCPPPEVGSRFSLPSPAVWQGPVSLWAAVAGLSCEGPHQVVFLMGEPRELQEEEEGSH